MVEFKRLIKIISLIDMVFSCLAAFSLGFFVLFTLFFTTAVEVSTANTGDATLIQDTSLLLTLLWFLVIIMIMTTAVKTRAAYKLHKACKIDTDPKDSYLLCKSWRNVNLIFLSVNIASCLLGYRRFCLSAIILYIVPLYVVHGYMRELLAIEESRRIQSVITGECNPGIKFDGQPNVSVAFQPVAHCPQFPNESNPNAPQWT